MKNLIQFLRLIYSITFFSLFLNHASDFESKYVRFATLNMVADYHLAFIYYFMTAFEIMSALVIFINMKNSFFKFYDFALALYLVVAIGLLLAFSRSYECIECHYVANAFYLDHKNTLIVIGGLAFLYYFLITNKKLLSRIIPEAK